MNRNQMTFRCPDAKVVGCVRLEGYRLAFRTNGDRNGVATILPEPDSFVDGVLWRISERDERRLDHYEGFPYLYGKAPCHRDRSKRPEAGSYGLLHEQPV